MQFSLKKIGKDATELFTKYQNKKLYTAGQLRNLNIPLSHKLGHIAESFKKKVRKDLDITLEEAKLLYFLLKFLFDLNVLDREFWQLTDSHQRSFKTFIIDRFFKSEASRSKDYLAIYHDISVYSDNLSVLSNNSYVPGLVDDASGVLRGGGNRSEISEHSQRFRGGKEAIANGGQIQAGRGMFAVFYCFLYIFF